MKKNKYPLFINPGTVIVKGWVIYNGSNVEGTVTTAHGPWFPNALPYKQKIKKHAKHRNL
jgi:hypothetical protein